MLAPHRLVVGVGLALALLGLEGVAEFLEDLDVLVVLFEFLFGLLDGEHKFAVGTRLLVALGVTIIKLPEFRSAQFGTDFLLTYYNTVCCRRRKRPCTAAPPPAKSGAPCPPKSDSTNEGRPPGVPADLRPQHLLLLVDCLLLLFPARHSLN